MGKSKSSSRDYSKGQKDGTDHAKHERDDGVIGVITDQINDPRYDHKGSEEYKEGFRDGRKSEQSKKK